MLCVGEAKWMPNRSSQLARLAVYLESLIWIAQMPQNQRQIATVSYPGVLAHPCYPRACQLLIIVVRESPLILITGAYKITTVEKRDAQQEQSLHPNAGIIESLGERNALFGES